MTLRDPYSRPVHPGEILREDLLQPLGLSAADFSQQSGIALEDVEAILAEARPISTAEADFIGTLCGNGADIWLRLQAAYDSWQPPAHDFRHATMHSLADWPVLSRIAARHTKAKRLDSRAVAALYARATIEDRQAMDSRELAYADAALSV